MDATTSRDARELVGPERQIRNVGRCLEAALAAPERPGRLGRIRAVAAQYIELVEAHLAGRLAPIPAATDEMPF